MESDDTQRNRTGDTDRNRERQEDRQAQRRNPRLVFSDPDRFFRDLLMEQQEQN